MSLEKTHGTDNFINITERLQRSSFNSCFKILCTVSKRVIVYYMRVYMPIATVGHIACYPQNKFSGATIKSSYKNILLFSKCYLWRKSRTSRQRR